MSIMDLKELLIFPRLSRKIESNWVRMRIRTLIILLIAVILIYAKSVFEIIIKRHGNTEFQYSVTFLYCSRLL